MPFDLRTMNANLDAARSAQRMLDQACVGLGAFESARIAMEGARLGQAGSWIKDFDALGGVAASALNATAGVGGVHLARGLASLSFPTTAVEAVKPVLDLKPPHVDWTKLAMGSDARARATDMLRPQTEGLFSSLSKAYGQPGLGAALRLAESVAWPGVWRLPAQPEWVTAMASISTGRGMFEAFGGIAAFGGMRAVQDASARMLGWSDFLAPHFETLARAARNVAAHVAAQPNLPFWGVLGVKALEALEAFDEGRHWIADTFLKGYLRLHPTPERREALWAVLKKGFEAAFASPPPWLTLDQKRATTYLRVAVYREAERIKRDREMADRVWWKSEGEAPVLDPEPKNRLVGFSEDPADIVSRRMDDRNQILDVLLVSGSPRDRRIVGLIRDGSYDRAEIRNMVGSSNLQSFERKAQRMRAEISFS